MGDDNILDGTRGAATQQQDKSDSGNEKPRRSAILIAYLHEFLQGTVETKRRPEIHHLSESGLLRIEASVLEIEAKARETIATNFATMLPTEEHTETYERALDSDVDTAAKWLTTLMFRECLGLPIFTLVADECLVTVARADLPLCLESAAQFALAHMPPDEDFVPQLRLKEFKLYLAKALRRDAERVGSKTSGGGQPKPDGDHQEAPAGNTSNKSASTNASGFRGEPSAFRERTTGSMDRVSMTDPIWDFSGTQTQNGPISIKRLSGEVDVIDPSIEDEPDDADLKPEEEHGINEATIGGRSELRSEIETAFSGPDWPPPRAIIQAFRHHAVKVFDANAAAYHRAISEQQRDAKETLTAMSRNLLVGLFGREWKNSPGERVVRIRWEDGVDGWKGQEIAVIAGNDPDPTCLYHQLVGDAIKHRYRFHAPLPPHVPGEPPGLGVSNLEWWQYIGLKERHNLAMVIQPYLEDWIAHWQVVYSAPRPKVDAFHVQPTATTSSDTAQTQSDLAAKRQSIVMPILKQKRWSRGKLVTESGVGKNCVYEYLDGTRNPGYDNRKAMADALGLTEDQLPQ